MQDVKTERPMSDHDTNLYDAVKKAVIQLNVWLTSIEDSIKSCLEISDSERVGKFKELYSKMKLHQECLKRIVNICQDLLTRTNTSDMSIINEYIIFVSDRFQRVHHHVEMALRMNDSDIIDQQCGIILQKINLYDNIVLSLCKQEDININNISQPSNIMAHIQKIKYIFNRYTEELDSISEKLKEANKKDFDQFKSEIETLYKSLKIIEQSIDQQWTVLSTVFKPYKLQSEIDAVRVSESWDIVQLLLKQDISHSNNIIRSSESESLLLMEMVDKCEQLVTFSSETFLLNEEKYCKPIKLNTQLIKLTSHISDMTKDVHNFNVEPLKIYTNTFMAHYLKRVIATYKLALCFFLDLTPMLNCVHFSQFIATNINPDRTITLLHKPHIRQKPTLCIDSICAHPNTVYSTTVFKCAPHQDFLTMLSTSLSIMSTSNRNTDSMLHQHMQDYEKSRTYLFEKEYQLLSDECFAYSLEQISRMEEMQSQRNLQNRFSIDRTPFDSALSPSITNIFQAIFSTTVLNEISSPMKYSNARARLAKPIIDFIKNNLQFDIGFGFVLIVRKAVFQMINAVQFEQFLRSICEVNRYRLMSAAV